MTTQGLLVVDQNGQDFLLTTERLDTKTYRLVVLQRINGKWERLDEPEGGARRESLIGAFVDFIVDICRVLNSSSLDRSPTITSAPGRFAAGASPQTKHKRDQ